MPGAFQFYVDGVLQTTINANIPDATPLRIAASSYLTGGPALQVDWVRQTGGTFTSSVFSAGGTATWGTVNWTAAVPAGTTMIVETRSGNTATPDGSWSSWSVASNGATVSRPERAVLAVPGDLHHHGPEHAGGAVDPLPTPVLDDITFNWS